MLKECAGIWALFCWHGNYLDLYMFIFLNLWDEVLDLVNLV